MHPLAGPSGRTGSPVAQVQLSQGIGTGSSAQTHSADFLAGCLQLQHGAETAGLVGGGMSLAVHAHGEPQILASRGPSVAC